MSSKDYFDDVAQQWDEMRLRLFSETVRETAYTVAGLEAGRVAADIGAGTGFISEGLLERGLRVIAVDQSDKMLTAMREKFGEAATVDYRVGEAAQLPLEDGSVDYAFANMYLHHVAVPAQAIAEMVRILRPGGKLVITDMETHEFEFVKEEHHDVWMGFERADLRQWYEQVGLRNIEVAYAGDNCGTQSTASGEVAEISVFVASGEK